MVFVSKRWYMRLSTMSQPGPVDNFDYLCPHKLFGLSSADLAAEPFIPISKSLFNSLARRYGGGPVIKSFEICPKCQSHLSAYNDRKQIEFDLVSKYDTKDTGDGKGWYLVDAIWVNNWKRYVRSDNVSDTRDMCAPGPITNERLFDKDGTKLRDNLKLKVHYIGVNARVWWLFMHVHGGGPCFCREDLDIYSGEYIPETELYLKELRWGGTNREFARSMSRQLVDEFRGDVSAYEARYGCAKTDLPIGTAGVSLSLQVEELAVGEVTDVAQTWEVQAEDVNSRKK